ncbi:MAG: DUF5615 family PIN-like protein [Desulfurococcales archaeon]|nr:DUF5615 family PIN-like protein [Desulfurococcales archaeon]
MKQELKILLDENIGFKVYHELRRQGYHVQSILVEHRGASDEEVIETATKRGKIIVTMDKDFGYLAQAYNPPGVVILRLRDPRVPNRVRAILRALSLGEQLYGYITIVTDTRIRKRPITP